MKIRQSLLLLLSLVCCFVLLFPGNGTTTPSAKQLLINKINDADFTAALEKMLLANSGEYTLTVTALDGRFVDQDNELKSLAGASLNLGCKYNQMENQIELGYDLNLQQQDYSGQVYLTEKEVIFTTSALIELMQSELFSEMSFGELELLTVMDENPQYYVLPLDYSADLVWSQTPNADDIATITAAFKGFMVFFVESLPDKYISYSVKNQSIVFALNSEGLAEVIHAFMLKGISEPDRLAGMIGDIVTMFYPSGTRAWERETIIEDIKYELELMAEDGVPTVAEIKESIESGFLLRELRLELSLASKNNSFVLYGVFPESSGLTGDLRINIGITGDEDKYTGKTSFNLTMNSWYDTSVAYHEQYEGIQDSISGTYSLSFNMVESDPAYDEYTVEASVKGTYTEVPREIASQNELAVLVSDADGKLLNLKLAITTKDQYDPDLVINVPQMTRANSFDISNLMSGFVEAIYINGYPVETVLYYGQIMIPLREAAELLGCTVEWFEPDQIVVTGSDVVIEMNLDYYIYTINGEERFMMSPTLWDDKTTMVPYQVLTEALDCSLIYRGQSKTLLINER